YDRACRKPKNQAAHASVHSATTFLNKNNIHVRASLMQSMLNMCAARTTKTNCSCTCSNIFMSVDMWSTVQKISVCKKMHTFKYKN
ncbi:MAG: hypothetical protein ACKPKO_53620, partial [Candidatus Fonsibacter sp.]